MLQLMLGLAGIFMNILILLFKNETKYNNYNNSFDLSDCYGHYWLALLFRKGRIPAIRNNLHLNINNNYNIIFRFKKKR